MKELTIEFQIGYRYFCDYGELSFIRESERDKSVQTIPLPYLLHVAVDDEGFIRPYKRDLIHNADIITLVNWDAARSFLILNYPELLPMFEKFTLNIEQDFISVRYA